MKDIFEWGGGGFLGSRFMFLSLDACHDPDSGQILTTTEVESRL